MEFNFMYKGDFTPTEIQDISKCLGNLSSIPEGTIPLARRMGLSWGNLSQIPADMENDYATEFVEKVEEFENRVSASDVSFSFDTDGVSTVNAIIEKGDEYDAINQ
jgi:hypothetical protein